MTISIEPCFQCFVSGINSCGVRYDAGEICKLWGRKAGSYDRIYLSYVVFMWLLSLGCLQPITGKKTGLGTLNLDPWEPPSSFWWCNEQRCAVCGVSHICREIKHSHGHSPYLYFVLSFSFSSLCFVQVSRKASMPILCVISIILTL